MDVMQITGGTPLEGEIKLSGAKNSFTKLLVASLLSDKACTFYNVPNIGDVEVTVNLCKEIGAKIDWDKEKGILHIQTKNITTSYIPQRFSGANRIPILMIGALLGRTCEDVIVPTAGGCQIGKRPIDFHIQALEKLGATIEYRTMKKEGAYFAHAHDGLQGGIIELPFPSVGATENSILAAVRAKGKTTIKNVAIEPEIVDLVLFLQKLGVNIAFEVDRTIKVEETHDFHEVQHHVIPDRTVAASFAMAAVATKGRVFVKGARQSDMIYFLNELRKIGGGFDIKEEGIEFFYHRNLNGGVHLETDVHPGFLTDWQQPFVILLTQASGLSIIHETVYENRFGYTHTLNQMGADIQLFKQCLGDKKCRYSMSNYHHSIIVKGPTPLSAQEILIPDLRAGFAYVMAALIAEGTSIIKNLHFLERGYENLIGQLQILGANIQLVSLPDRHDNLSNSLQKPESSIALAALAEK